MRAAWLLALAACGCTPPDDSIPVHRDAGADARSDARLAPADVSFDDVKVVVTPDGALRQSPLRVLFVGDAYTAAHDLPGLVARMATASRARAIAATSVTPTAATLRDQWTSGDAPARMMASPWDAVVLQGDGVEPASNYAAFRTYAVRFGTLAHDERTRAVYFATWPRAEGDMLYEYPFSGGSPAVLAERLDTAYAQVAATVGGEVARVGDAWMRARRERPALQLYDADGGAPSLAGSWLAACVIYRAVTGNAPAPEADALSGVAADDARYLRELAASQR